MATQQKIDDLKQALIAIQNFDASALARTQELGQLNDFAEVINNANSIINLYKKLPASIVDDLPEGHINGIKNAIDADNNLFNRVMTFDPQQNNAPQVRTGLLNEFSGRKDTVFNAIWQFIAYAAATPMNLSSYELQAQSTLKSIEEKVKGVSELLDVSSKEAENTLSEIRAIAAEQGVSQQAIYFKSENEYHEKAAKKWLISVSIFATLLGLSAIGSLFLHKVEWLAPKDALEVSQFITSKFLVFGVLAYVLLLSARNYKTHKHNAVLNKHRQNALLTYRSLVDAAGEKGTEDIVLANAASCIFSPQDTGYTNNKGELPGGKSVLELFTKSVSSSHNE